MVEIAEVKELQSLMQWREEVIEHVFGMKPDENLIEANRRYYSEHIPSGSHIAFAARVDGEDAGCGAVCFTDELPSPDNPSGKCAYLMSIYVREAFRSRGIAHMIVTHLIEESKRRGCEKIYLETTAEGEPVYISLGFKEMDGMMKYYDSDN